MPAVAYPDAATIVFNLSGYQVISVRILALDQRRIHAESVLEAGCRGCGVISRRRHSRRLQRIRDVLLAGPVDVMWVRYRFFCDESECSRQTFSEATPQVPAFSHSTARLRQSLVDAVVDSDRAAAETAVAFGVS
ncbi:transposase family protein [Arthrobacter sp. H20]|uniref:transposase family protein n=1 Tax=Arthrobacter sp. H20 TaxID=1267981 RepID=UPI00047A1D61|nr:transposase family protein [Arthrobacter sp. H20]